MVHRKKTIRDSLPDHLVEAFEGVASNPRSTRIASEFFNKGYDYMSKCGILIRVPLITRSISLIFDASHIDGRRFGLCYMPGLILDSMGAAYQTLGKDNCVNVTVKRMRTYKWEKERRDGIYVSLRELFQKVPYKVVIGGVAKSGREEVYTL